MNFHLRLPWPAPQSVPADVLDQLCAQAVEIAALREALRRCRKRGEDDPLLKRISVQAQTTAQLRKELGAAR